MLQTNHAYDYQRGSGGKYAQLSSPEQQAKTRLAGAAQSEVDPNIVN